MAAARGGGGVRTVREGGANRSFLRSPLKTPEPPRPPQDSGAPSRLRSVHAGTGSWCLSGSSVQSGNVFEEMFYKLRLGKDGARRASRSQHQ